MSVEFIKGLENYKPQPPQSSVVTIGTFDGIHRGHQAILKRVNEVAHENGGLNPVLVTFHPHPRVVVTPESIPLLLTTIQEKEKFIPDFFDGQVLILNFNDELKNLDAEEFVKKILVETLGAKKLIVGYDHAFGRNRSGNIEKLTELGQVYDFDVEVVGPVIHQDQPISSSRIRKATLAGHYDLAIELMGHYYAISGPVERGLGLGRRLGYPTANVGYDMRKLLPPEGVYACWAQVEGEEKDGMMFIGKNHFNPQKLITVEANLFDFDRDIYDKEIIVYPTTFIRENRKFDSTDELIEQIAKDKKDVLEIIDKEKQNGYEQRSKSSNCQN